MPSNRPSTTVARSRHWGGFTSTNGAAQYLSIKYTTRLADVGTEPSVGSVRDSYDNALTETTSACSRPKSSIIGVHGAASKTAEYATLEWPYGDAGIAYPLTGRLVR